MQIDMHYYGTYALARLAGLKPRACTTIATAAQFVDDSAKRTEINFMDGGHISAKATAHHVADIKNLEREDQRLIWVPFHFLPGGQGQTFSERLVCQKDSAIARQMLKHHLSYASHSCGLHLSGIAAHVYADTFAHHGFSGTSSRLNKVVNNSFIFNGMAQKQKDNLNNLRDDFFRRYGNGSFEHFKSWVAETASGALGHGAVATYPDEPYLKWQFEYQHSGKLAIRNNPADFLAGCQALHLFFIRLGQENPSLISHAPIEFAAARPAISRIINTEADKQKRSRLWRQAAKSGQLSGYRFNIPSYDSRSWQGIENSGDSSAALSSHFYRYHQAAAIHRSFVLRELLPSKGLIVV